MPRSSRKHQARVCGRSAGRVGAPALAIVALVAVFGLAAFADSVYAQRSPRINATVTYTGNMGPVSEARPLCLCPYVDAQLRQSFPCYISSRNGALFSVTTFDTHNYYLVAFLDLNESEGLDPGEPYEIYNDHASPPADPVAPSRSNPPSIDITFGDENLLTATPTETATPTATPSITTTPEPCTGDCDGSRTVTIDEILTLVDIALGKLQVGACNKGNLNGDDGIEINEIVAAVRNASSGCPGTR